MKIILTFIEKLSNPEVTKFYDPSLPIKQYVFRFDVPVGYIGYFVAVVHRRKDLFEVEAGLLFFERLLLLIEFVLKSAPWEILENQVNFIAPWVLNQFYHSHDVSVLQALEHFDFLQQGTTIFVFLHSILFHRLHSVLCLLFQVDAEEYFAEGAHPEHL